VKEDFSLRHPYRLSALQEKGQRLGPKSPEDADAMKEVKVHEREPSESHPSRSRIAAGVQQLFQYS
jgi:hypothetical protein